MISWLATRVAVFGIDRGGGSGAESRGRFGVLSKRQCRNGGAVASPGEAFAALHAMESLNSSSRVATPPTGSRSISVGTTQRSRPVGLRPLEILRRRPLGRRSWAPSPGPLKDRLDWPTTRESSTSQLSLDVSPAVCPRWRPPGPVATASQTGISMLLPQPAASPATRGLRGLRATRSCRRLSCQMWTMATGRNGTSTP